MRRRQFIMLLGSAAAVGLRALPGFAQRLSKRPLIACSVGGSRTATERYFGGFSQGMRELGYVEGRDYVFEVRYAEGQLDLIPAQMDELVHLCWDEVELALGVTHLEDVVATFDVAEFAHPL